MKKEKSDVLQILEQFGITLHDMDDQAKSAFDNMIVLGQAVSEVKAQLGDTDKITTVKVRDQDGRFKVVTSNDVVARIKARKHYPF